MAGPEHHSSMEFDRRASTRSSLPPQPQYIHFDEDDDEEDYDLQAMGISDGFRPQGDMAMTGHNRISSGASQYIPPGRSRTPPPRPSSTTKPRALDSFALRHDGGMATDPRRISTLASNDFNAAPTRSSSVSTDMPYMRPESPYQGPSGPSHPYQMYPQESRLARTASIATTSTAAVMAPERPYNGPGGPTHPYGMYPQNTVPEAESVVDVMAPVPVGFPGLNNNYQRRLGPEGEEMADIIGPDGHTEQLPPYTKYPDEAIARKIRPTVVIPVDGAGGMGLATRNPEFSSAEELESPSRQSTRSAMSGHSNHQVNVAAIGASEKPELNKWQKMARKKVCGVVPVWVLVLIGIMFVVFAIILGTVLAVLKPKHPPGGGPNGDNPPSGKRPLYDTTMTATSDATPLTASPTGIPDLPTGAYSLPLSAPAAIQNSCLSNTDQSSAWSCEIPMTSFNIAVTPIMSGSALASYEVNLSLGNDTFRESYAYGTQPPVLSQDQVLNLITDSDADDKGPAWFSEMPYNKIVILPEPSFTDPAATTRGKRNHDKRGNEGRGESRSPGDFQRKYAAQPGDMPWFCYWNGTLLEAYIYVNLTSSAGQSSSTTSAYGSSPTETRSPQELGYLPAYPRVLKIEERRVLGPQSIPPYCVQHQIDKYGGAHVALNSSNEPIVVYLSETESSAVSQMAVRNLRTGHGVDRMVKRQETTSGCGCVWLWT
ncbi:hypothetical protein LZ554_005362 [Drepanopeziza brunnea f. sp. 'monogermtubi']|nr:hypothetical protein LZ554_005362 [Drepanopeziza brunnea f. sp. 'monogermtubi']